MYLKFLNFVYWSSKAVLSVVTYLFFLIMVNVTNIDKDFNNHSVSEASCFRPQVKNR